MSYGDKYVVSEFIIDIYKKVQQIVTCSGMETLTFAKLSKIDDKRNIACEIFLVCMSTLPLILKYLHRQTFQRKYFNTREFKRVNLRILFVTNN